MSAGGEESAYVLQGCSRRSPGSVHGARARYGVPWIAGAAKFGRLMERLAV